MSSTVKSISIIGAGNVATQLVKAFMNSPVTVSHIANRDISKGEALANFAEATFCNIRALPVDQLAIICVSDNAISGVLEKLDSRIPAAYTSGSVDLETLPKRSQLGVFYPLQTFSKESNINFKMVPFFIESTTPEFSEALSELASVISETVRSVDSEYRRKLHLSAVFINNFTNHIIEKSQELAESNQIEFSYLMPLLEETVSKLKTQSPYNAQTGPARRNDSSTINKQLNALTGINRELYDLLTRSIQKTYSDDD